MHRTTSFNKNTGPENKKTPRPVFVRVSGIHEAVNLAEGGKEAIKQAAMWTKQPGSPYFQSKIPKWITDHEVLSPNHSVVKGPKFKKIENKKTEEVPDEKINSHTIDEPQDSINLKNKADIRTELSEQPAPKGNVDYSLESRRTTKGTDSRPENPELAQIYLTQKARLMVAEAQDNERNKSHGDIEQAAA